MLGPFGAPKRSKMNSGALERPKSSEHASERLPTSVLEAILEAISKDFRMAFWDSSVPVRCKATFENTAFPQASPTEFYVFAIPSDYKDCQFLAANAIKKR